MSELKEKRMTENAENSQSKDNKSYNPNKDDKK